MTVALFLVFAWCSYAASPPNIVVILADDMGYSDIGCFGGEINTPNIDKMATEGLRFTQFYNAGRCCPTRASLLTGLYPHQAGMGGMVNGGGDTRPPGPYQGYLNDQCVTIAEVLKSAGYGTYMSGKWHVGEEQPHWPTDRGFDRYFGLISGGMNYFDIAKSKADGVVRRFAINDQTYRPPNKDWYMTDATTDHAVQYLDEAASKDAPFFLYLAYTAPHWPLHAPEDVVEKYLGTYREGWSKLRNARYERMRAMGILSENAELSASDEGVANWEEVDNALMDRKMAIYAAQVEIMDRGIGNVLDKLDTMGARENTIVMFLSDNGGCHEGGPLGFDRRHNGVSPGKVDSYMSYGQSWANMSNTPFRMYKHWVHEGGIATPLVVRWPEGVAQPARITQDMGHIVDILATCVALSGASYPTTKNGKAVPVMVGESLVPSFQGNRQQERGPLFWEHMGNRAVRDGDWKLVAKKGGSWELYNLVADRSEIKNRASENPERVHALSDSYARWASKVGVKPKS